VLRKVSTDGRCGGLADRLVGGRSIGSVLSITIIIITTHRRRRLLLPIAVVYRARRAFVSDRAIGTIPVVVRPPSIRSLYRSVRNGSLETPSRTSLEGVEDRPRRRSLRPPLDVSTPPAHLSSRRAWVLDLDRTAKLRRRCVSSVTPVRRRFSIVSAAVRSRALASDPPTRSNSERSTSPLSRRSVFRPIVSIVIFRATERIMGRRKRWRRRRRR